MKRRNCFALLGGAALAVPFGARAQQPSKLPKIGFLGTPEPAIWKPRTAAFVQRLAELGGIDGGTVSIEYRWAGGRSERFAEIAMEFVRLDVDVILTSGAAVTAVKQVTSTIPTVFAIDSDPVGSRHVASLAHPGGNVTGLSLQAPDVAGKRFEMLREVTPSLRRVALMANVDNPASATEMNDVEGLARKLGHEVVRLEIRRTDDIEPALASLSAGAFALYVCGYDPLMNSSRDRIVRLAAAARLPAIFGEQNYVKAGGLMSYGPNFVDLFRRSAGYVDKILRGAKPGDLPVEQPTKFDLAINLRTAKALGLNVPPTLLALADDVLE